MERRFDLFSILLKPLRTKEGVNQVNEQTDRGNAGNDVIHWIVLLQLVAGFREAPADEQKHTTDGNVKYVEHGNLLRFCEDHFVAGATQLPGQAFLRCWPPSLASAEDDEGPWPQRSS